MAPCQRIVWRSSIKTAHEPPPMTYGKTLLDKAAEKAGSRYALAKITGIAESGLSRAATGERDVPAAWVLPLAQIAGVNPTAAMEAWSQERAQKKKARAAKRAERAGNMDEAGGKDPVSLTDYASYRVAVYASRHDCRETPRSCGPLRLSAVVSSGVRGVQRSLNSLFIRARWALWRAGMVAASVSPWRAAARSRSVPGSLALA